MKRTTAFSLFTSLFVTGTTLALNADDPAKDKAPAKEETTKTEKPATEKPATDKPAQPAQPAEEKIEAVYYVMSTTEGDIVLELNKTKAPITVANFEKYAEKGHYDGTIFHRVMKTFMIQGGGHDSTGKEKATDAPIKNEWQNGLKNKRYTIAMARKGDIKPNPDRVNSATSQFFINTNDNAGLDRQQQDGGAYCVFGKVIAGKEVVDKIAGSEVAATERGEMSKPVSPVSIKKMTRISKEDAMGKVKPDDGKPADKKPAASDEKKEKKDDKSTDKK